MVNLEPVQAGDLITAKNFNELIDEIKTLKSSVEELQERVVHAAPAFVEHLFLMASPSVNRSIIEGQKIGGLLEEALGVLPFDIQEHEFMWTYWVRQNKQRDSERRATSYLLFTSGFVSFAGSTI